MFIYTIIGSMTGMLWMEGRAWKPVEYKFSTDGKSRPWIANADNLNEAVEMLMRAEDGDFRSSAKLTSDSILRVDWHRKTRTVTRIFNLSDFGSISEYMDSQPTPEELLV